MQALPTGVAHECLENHPARCRASAQVELQSNDAEVLRQDAVAASV